MYPVFVAYKVLWTPDIPPQDASVFALPGVRDQAKIVYPVES